VADNAVMGAYLGGIGPLSLTNAIFWNNGDDLSVEPGTPITVVCCDIGDGDYAGSNGNFSVDPLFDTTSGDGYELSDMSWCIDAGTSDGAPSADLLGVPRRDILSVPNVGTGDRPWYDVGAYEYRRYGGWWHRWWAWRCLCFRVFKLLPPIPETALTAPATVSQPQVPAADPAGPPEP
jgi:hypothetical protein